MGLLGDFLAAVDNRKRVVKRGLLDFINDPNGTAQVLADRASEDRYGGPEELAAVRNYDKGKPYDKQAYARAEKTMQDRALNQAFNAITVWHGSPHKFDKFDMSKIGTGEGAQAYGHGLYMAESDKVAGEYAKANQGRAAVHAGALDGIPKEFEMEAYKALQMPDSPFKKAAIDDIKIRMKSKGYDVSPLQIGETSGNLYKVDIPDEAVARFLDWDKPLSQQAPEVRNALGVSDGYFGVPLSSGETMYAHGGSMAGVDLHNELTSLMGEGSKTAASDFLKSKGIPGIRYLDGGSRGQQAGTSNFVLFDDQMPRILEINGVPTGNKPWANGEWRGLLGD